MAMIMTQLHQKGARNDNCDLALWQSDFGASDVVKPLMVYHAVMVLCVM